MTELVSTVSFLIFPAFYLWLIVLSKWSNFRTEIWRVGFFLFFGWLVHHPASPLFYDSDASHYVDLAHLIIDGEISPIGVLTESKALWSASLAILSLGFLDPTSLAIGLSVTLLCVTATQLRAMAIKVSPNYLGWLELTTFSLSTSVLLFGPSPLREALFWAGGALLAQGLFSLRDGPLTTRIITHLTLGVCFLSVARVEVGFPLAIWASFLVVSNLVATRDRRDWRVSLFAIAVANSGTLFFLSNFNRIFVASVPAQLQDIQTSEGATTVFEPSQEVPSDNDSHSFGSSFVRNLLGFSFQAYSSAVGLRENFFFLTSYLPWLLLLLGLVALPFTRTSAARFYDVVYWLGPLGVLAQVSLVVNNLGTAVRFRTIVLVLLFPYMAMGWITLVHQARRVFSKIRQWFSFGRNQVERPTL